MADPRFFRVAGPFTLRALAEIASARIAPGSDPECLFKDVAPIDCAQEGDFTFLDNNKYVDSFKTSKAGGCVIHPSLADKAPPGMALLLCDQPYRAYAYIAQAFYPVSIGEAVVAPTACVDPTAHIGRNCRIDAGAVIGANAEIDDDCWIGPNAVIDDGVILGKQCRVGANASVSHCVAGNQVIIYPGVRIGQDGFGFAMGGGGHLKIPQLGRVVIEDDVEIGANTTIDRGAGPDTVIGAGSRIDNLVQIGHNVRLGRGCVVVSQTGISGSTHLGNFVVVGGQVGVAGHLKIGDGAQIAAQSGIMRDVPAKAVMGGSPAMLLVEWMRCSIILGKMARSRAKEKKATHE